MNTLSPAVVQITQAIFFLKHDQVKQLVQETMLSAEEKKYLLDVAQAKIYHLAIPYMPYHNVGIPIRKTPLSYMLAVLAAFTVTPAIITSLVLFKNHHAFLAPIPLIVFFTFLWYIIRIYKKPVHTMYSLYKTAVEIKEIIEHAPVKA